MYEKLVKKKSKSTILFIYAKNINNTNSNIIKLILSHIY